MEWRNPTAELNFVRQQGFKDASLETTAYQYPALMWQPRVIAVLVLVGVAFQAWPVFLALWALLWWSLALPDRNPFDAVYARLVAAPMGRPRPDPAPGPRRFGAQGPAGALMLVTALSLLAGWHALAWALEAIVSGVLALVIFGRFCLGSYLFLLLHGEADFAKRTLPWARGDVAGQTLS